VTVACCVLLGCSNNPYPEAHQQKKVLYLPFATPPKTLDPAISYGTADTVVTNKVFDTLLQYHYVKRPYELEPSMASLIPEAEPLPDGRVRYTFTLRPGISYHGDACFELSQPASNSSRGPSRRVTAADIVFELQRVADPLLASQVVETFARLTGFSEFRKRLEERRAKDSSFAKRPAHEQYRELGGFDGALALDERTLQITLIEPYPQILYWFAMPVTTPVPWEAVAYYSGEGGHPPLTEYAVSTGPYVLVDYDKQARMVLERNPEWWGLADPSVGRFPDVSGLPEVDDLFPSIGRALPILDRIEYRREPESIPAFAKFLQGYYDMSGITRESFDKVVREGGLSPAMKKKGMRLSRSVEPGVYYIGFNLEDATVGGPDAERARLLRQAMSLVIDVKEYLRLFSNGRGLPAHSPIPPGLFGYDETYKNEFRIVNLERARQLLTQAGYPGGIDPKTGSPLHLTFDVADTSAEGRVRYMFWVNQWRKLGINVELSATNYNQFYAKMLKGSYQIFTWGWMADYPDPENFLFLLTTKMAHSVSGGPNNTNFKNPAYDALFDQMRTRPNDKERQRIINQMLKILEKERPWIELFFPEDYELVHGWVKNVRTVGISTVPTAKYYDLDQEERAQLRERWNRPIFWPAWVLLAAGLVIVIPAVMTYRKERK
jgi:oligopeptide transport system substrate-binding protein